ncbi:MAG: hypothetical protein D6709_00205 [Chloroflexi bacterium]|uniref:Uncharacterized protein n=1 Tax=Candidatus Thermofonsia Clade 3 bacterium TaxID=2364212 RepID=A0A2M8QEN6_9CHLR|nr:MAG: hypothetical protein CUN48_04440 [Candidatus Thermofonsia Clade 3 bacterium]RMG66262.1 MAG: hypothetical protein D6709_00205 [Chloroflexota bacterium]
MSHTERRLGDASRVSAAVAEGVGVGAGVAVGSGVSVAAGIAAGAGEHDARMSARTLTINRRSIGAILLVAQEWNT